MLPHNHPGKISNLSGVNDTYKPPQNADLLINTHLESEVKGIKTVSHFILEKNSVLNSKLDESTFPHAKL